MANELSKSQIESYQRDGYLLIEDAIPAAVLHQLQLTTQALIEASAPVTQSNDIYDLDKGHSPTSPRLNRIKTPHLVDPVYKALLQSDAILNPLKSLLGNNIRLHNSKLNTKAPQGGAAVQWHQDWAFYPHTNDDLLAVGVMLSDMNEQDGPMQMVPGSHTSELLPHFQNGVFCGAIDPSLPEANLNKAKMITGKAGSVSFHHVRTLHGSSPNLGSNPRLLLLYEVGAADAWPINGAQNAYTGLSQSELWQRFNENLICGEQPTTARLANVPVSMPVPPPEDATSIFAIQRSGKAIDQFA